MTATTVVPAVLRATTTVTNADAVYVTGAANAQTVIKRAVITNITAGAIAFDMWRVISGGSSADGNLICKTQSVPATSTYPCPELANMVLLPGDTIHIQASANTSLNFTASGFVIS